MKDPTALLSMLSLIKIVSCVKPQCLLLSAKVLLASYQYSISFILLPVPGEVDLPPEVESNDFDDAFVNGVIDVTVRWNPPGDPNGVITRYNVEFVAISTNFPAVPNSQRRKRQPSPVQQECIMGGADSVNRTTSVPGTQNSTNLAGLSKLLL